MIDPIMGHPRFVALLDRLGISEHAVTHSQSDATVDRRGDKSIVVLPFENLSPDPDNAFFADGLTEEIIADLSKVKALRVISRTSAMVLKDSHKDVPTIARDLNVRYVLEGSVRRAGNSLRITAQLIDAQNDAHLWAEKYTGTLDDVFDLQERLSRSIVDELEVTLTSEEDKRIATRPIADVRAHDIWLRARQYTLSLTKDGPERAHKLVEEALEITGDNALLHATLAWINGVRYPSTVDNADVVLRLADRHAALAIELDPDLAWSHFASSIVSNRRGDIQEFIRRAQRALELERDSHTLAVLALYVSYAGRVETASNYAEEAAELDPLSWLTTYPRGVVELMGGRAGRALTIVHDAYNRHGRGEVWPTYDLAYIALQAGEEEESVRLFSEVAGGDYPHYSALSRLFVHALKGKRGEAIEVVEKTDVKALAPRDGAAACRVGACFARVGETERALEWLAKGIDMGFTNHRYLGQYERLLAPIRADPRFEALMERAREKESALVV
jgi:TolB-like protein/tetratricopeptide (TPR) repeat protein